MNWNRARKGFSRGKMVLAPSGALSIPCTTIDYSSDSRLEEEEARRHEKDQMEEVEEEVKKVVAVVEERDHDDEEGEDFILREQVNSLKLQVLPLNVK